MTSSPPASLADAPDRSAVGFAPQRRGAAPIPRRSRRVDGRPMKIHRVLLPALLALAFALACAGQASAANCADCDDPGGGGGPPPGGQVSHAGPPETTISGWSGNNPMT